MPEVVLALETGVRRGELLGFFKSDFDTRRHVYSVARTVRKPRGQAPETAAPKSLSYRTNPLTDRALQAVELLRQRYPDSPYPVSYTHLDVYKRQCLPCGRYCGRHTGCHLRVAA